ncbi:GNAT family N-acetyltransferase [Streptomyces roseolus]|uniref:GNAT family N-acetyltransferase n=1 Tax=Streptomyces roseolus TaxID=67358 RepID=UPI00167A1D1E|nr:GNAT family N-acetyltransferase [Streptomyces roseolus]GGR13894.1 hypothetical protein GCM10010282_02840 [Streptomyces roseolus]
MELVQAEPVRPSSGPADPADPAHRAAPATPATYRYWPADLHRPQVVLRSGRHRVTCVLDERTADGTLVLTAPEPDRLSGIRPGARLALLFRGDGRRPGGGAPVPLFSRDHTVDHRTGRIEVRPPAVRDDAHTHALAEPITARLDSPTLFARPQRVTIGRLGPYGGEFSADDPGRLLAPGMSVTLDLWLPWLGGRRIAARLTSCRQSGGEARFSFRTATRRSVRDCAVVLAGTVPEFGFPALRAAGVRPSRVNRYLSIRTVADEATYRQALDVRLAGNRHFGRLADVGDSSEVGDRLDRHAVGIVCRLGDKPVGTGRIVVNAGDRDLSEIEAQTEGLPPHIWQGGFVEVSRLAIHPDYRGSGVVLALFREIARLAFNLGCRYLVLDAIDKLVPQYERLGGRKLPISKTHPYTKEPVRVMAIDIGEQLGRLGHDWPRWQYVFGPVVGHYLRTSSPHTLTALVHGLRRVPFRVKRVTSSLL